MAVKIYHRSRRKKIDPHKIIKTLKCKDIRILMGHCLIEYLDTFQAKKIREKKSEFLRGHGEKGCYENQMKHLLATGTDEELKSCIGLTHLEFNALYNHVRTKLEPKKGAAAEVACAKEKLMFVLSYLRSGTSWAHLSSFWLISRQTLGLYVEQVCRVLINVLSKEVDCRPKNSEDWLKIAKEFEDIWQLPNCVGAIDGKHIKVTKFKKTGSLLWNYKKHNSIILMAVTDANYRVIHFNVGNPGARSDGGVFAEDNLGAALRQGKLDLPPPRVFPRDKKNDIGPVPMYFVADDAFTSQTNLVKPFRIIGVGLEDEIYTNYRISRARVTIECLFGHLIRRFRVMGHMITSERVAQLIVKACIHLHNYLRWCRTGDAEELTVISKGKGKNVGRSAGAEADPVSGCTDVVTRYKLHMYVNTMGYQKIKK